MRFAAAFGSGEWGRLAGLWHDLGKYQPEFQRRLRGESVAVEHSGMGAALAADKDAERGIPLAFVLAGHHGGLSNLRKTGVGLPTPLIERVKVNETRLKKMFNALPPHLSGAELPQLPDFLITSTACNRSLLPELRRMNEFWIRFLFSSLVDADWLDTEEFLEPETAKLRSCFDNVGTLAKRLDSYIDRFVDSLPEDSRSSLVNRAREKVLFACRAASSEPPGTFRLTVPTGGGKTLSAMSFALRHAAIHDLNRVLVVIPYTSIIEQNAEIYKRALGAMNVIEHHSSFDVERQREALGEAPAQQQELAAENWDAPVIVTTTVQFFESLFSNRPSRCRKLHNIARSVIILDEVQTLPPRLLLSMMEALKELTSSYGCSVVLSTATPPALERRGAFEAGLSGVRDIIPGSSGLIGDLKRVDYIWPCGDPITVEWDSLAAEVSNHSQVLVIVHRRADARILSEMLKGITEPNTVQHLSALMCPEHRSDVIARIGHLLSSGNPCRVVSTQLVEAGVDLDFPIVYRAMAGMDSIVQAAGRCNREGRADRGRVIIFRAPTSPPPGTPKKGMETTDILLREAGGKLHPDDPALFERYFRMLYMKEDMDAQQIQVERQDFNFASVAERFHLIEDGFTRSVAVPYGDGVGWLDTLGREGASRETFRALQRYLVRIYPGTFDQLFDSGVLDQVAEGLYTLAPGFTHLYDECYGLSAGDRPQANPEELIV